MSTVRTKLIAVAVIAASMGGAAIASAALTGTSTTTTPAAQSGAPSGAQPGAPYGAGRGGPPGRPRDPSKGGHQANGKTETLLTGDTAAKVEAAAKAKVPGGTIERVENDVDTGSPYEAHVRKADGSEIVVYVDSSFKVTGTDAMGHP